MDYKNSLTSKSDDKNGKKLYKYLLKEINERNISEEKFIHFISDIIKESVDFTTFNNNMKNLLSV